MRPYISRIRVACATLVAAFALSACGGGSGGGGSGGGDSGQGRGTIGDDETVHQGAPELLWHAPTTNADGSCLDDLSGFRVNYGLSSGDYNDSRTKSLDELSSTPTGRSTDCGEVVAYAFPLDGLDTASWYITVQALDEGGNLSENSEELVVTVE